MVTLAGYRAINTDIAKVYCHADKKLMSWSTESERDIDGNPSRLLIKTRWLYSY